MVKDLHLCDNFSTASILVNPPCIESVEDGNERVEDDRCEEDVDDSLSVTELVHRSMSKTKTFEWVRNTKKNEETHGTNSGISAVLG